MREQVEIHLHVYNKAEKGWPYKTAQWDLSATIRGRYLGTLLKGW